MKKIIIWVVVILVVIFGIFYTFFYAQPSPTMTGVSSPSTNMGTNGSPNQTNTGQANVPPVVTIATDAKLGNILVSSDGMTLYTYKQDTTNVSNCSGVCAASWPPYGGIANEPLVAGVGVTGQLSSITRPDGTVQVTYKGMPLYLFKNDKNSGDTTGQNINGVWFVAKP